MAEILAYHGWGFDYRCWTPWVKWCNQRGHQIKLFDRGYFGQPHCPQFTVKHNSSEQAFHHPKVLLLHSFGLHLCPLETIQAADQVVIFSSFLSFHPEDPRLQRRSRRTVQKMCDRIQTHPQDVLHTFWANCYAPVTPLPAGSTTAIPSLHQRNDDRLQHDLKTLNETMIEPDSPLLNALQKVAKVVVIHGEADQIVPLSQGATLADAVPSSALVTVAHAGHALPFSHPDQCWTLPPFITL